MPSEWVAPLSVLFDPDKNGGDDMGKAKNLAGLRFGKWTAIKIVGKNCYGGMMWLCQCDCGTCKPVDGRSLRDGTSTSCGCNKAQKTREAGNRGNFKHGGKKERLYNIWNGMKDRCYNPKSKFFHRYGGRGIKVCDEWKHDYVAFRTWAIENGFDATKPRKYQSLDRIDNDGDYSPSNCKWRTSSEQCNNKSNNHLVRLGDEVKTITEWSRILGINKSTIEKRLTVYGYTDEEALTTPLKH